MLQTQETNEQAPAAITIAAFDNSYARLPARFHAKIDPSGARAPVLLAFNHALAEELGLQVEGLEAERLARIFSGTIVPEGAEPIAMAYAGHQFGQFVPQLGDGRAHLLGEVIDRAGRRRDLQLKGSGQTPFSRRGDGRAALGPVLREYLISEAMHALGIPTTRSLAAVATGEPVYREDILPGAILTRVARSHVRVGTFQYFAARGDDEGVRTLVDHMIAREYPEAADAPSPPLALLDGVVERQASLVARWMQVGFIHGVMNTDNTAISGETIDYGPCAFMDSYHPGQVFSSIDHMGRYAFANQPRIAHWNLARLAETLLPLLHETPETAIEIATEAVNRFAPRFAAHWLSVMRRKTGLSSTDAHGDQRDAQLIEQLLDAMAGPDGTVGADFTLTFRRLVRAAESPDTDAMLRRAFPEPEAFDAWAAAWRERLAIDPLSPSERAEMMRTANPAFIPRNVKVEEVLAAAEAGERAPFERFATILRRPFEDQPDAESFAEPAPPGLSFRTFCGT